MRRIAGIVVIVLVTLAVVRGCDNELSRNSPPPSCQAFGGQWSLWSGWRCG